MLKEIRLHGRGGQGVVTLGELIAIAAFYDGKQVSAFPSFGVERQGAPIESYVRLSDKKITRCDQIKNPDYIIILDDTLLTDKIIYQGLDKGDMVLVNTRKSENDLKRFFKIYPGISVNAIDATTLGMKILGKPIPNTALAGAFAAATNLINLKSLSKAISDKFGYKGEEMVQKNIEIAKKAYDHIHPGKDYYLVPGKEELAPYEKEEYRVAG